MPIDTLFTRGLAAELDDRLRGTRVDKIHMPARDRIMVHLHGPCGNVRLLVSGGGDARVHLTDTRPENPDKPPMLAMLLRKHLGAGRLLRVEQPGYERIINLVFSTTDEMGDPVERTLVCEMTGRMTNVILVDEEGTILACMKPVDHDMSDRAVLPGLKYRMPPRQELPLVFEEAPEEIRRICREAGNDADVIGRRLAGLPPLLLRQCAAQADPAQALIGLRSCTPRPYMLVKDGAYRDFASMPITHRDDLTSAEWPGFSALLDDFYRERAQAQGVKNAAQGMIKALTAAQKRLERKLANQRQELSTAQKREELKNRADLITSNLYAIGEGAEEITVTNYFSPDLEPVVIRLDPTLTPQENAQRLYKKYTRMKNAEEALARQLELGERELAYVKEVLYTIETVADSREIEDIRRELISTGYVRDRDKSARKPKPPAFRPLEYTLPGGETVLAGRNNTENDFLTHRHAHKLDLWFHARSIPGSHVILRTEGGTPSDEAIHSAARIAAKHSSGAASGRVAVDYTLVKHVKKPQGAKPGMVNYFEYKTVSAAPWEAADTAIEEEDK